MNNRKRRKIQPEKTPLNTALHVLTVIGVTLAFIVLACWLACLILLKGPSSTAKAVFTKSCYETSAMKWLPKLFISEDEYDAIINNDGMRKIAENVVIDTSKVVVDWDREDLDEITILDIKASTSTGKLMIINDPSKIFLGTVSEFKEGDGEVVKDIISHYDNVIGGINGGDFVDGDITYSAMPVGAVISQGEAWEDGSLETYHLCCMNEDNILVLGNISLETAKELNIRDAVYTKHETGPFLIMDGESMIDSVPNTATYGGGKNPRTAIGQRADGSILLLVLDGRQPSSLGATFKDLVEIMQEYGAVNACAMDGGTSTQMVYEGEVLNHVYNPGGPRKCPTAWLVSETGTHTK